MPGVSINQKLDSPSEGGEGRIFVVDDEALIGEFVGAILQQEGFEIACFSDPAVALREFHEAPVKPELLVTDYVMQPMNGMELIQKIRKAIPGFKAILYSGNVTEEITELYETPPDAFLNKPFQPTTLIDVVRKVLGSP